MAAVEDLLRQTALTPNDKRIELRLEGGFQGPPMEKTAATEALLVQARAVAEAIGLPLEDVATGGGSDGNRVAASGVPVLDGLGPVGGRAHSVDEFIDLDSVAPRTALLAGLLCRILGDGRS
jgi:glutamate carboxypeptidase